MKTIRAKNTFALFGRVFEKGEPAQVSDAEAADFIARRLAEPADDAPAADAPPAPAGDAQDGD